ncbi:ATP-binding protein [Streptomyces sp.]|uniref:ATP-binding protein n=1 Tax=Streptomyces sp. TaxID=1931 RepID=UPI002F4269DF
MNEAITTVQAPAPRTRPAIIARHRVALAIWPESARVGRVRQEVAATLRAWALAEAVDDSVLVVNELVANAVEYAPAEPIELTVTFGDGSLLIEVRDGSTAPPMRTEAAGPESEGGRGLEIVQALSSDWGWHPLEDAAKTVWALVPVRQAQLQP